MFQKPRSQKGRNERADVDGQVVPVVNAVHQVLIFGDYRKQVKQIAKVMNFRVLEG